MITDTELNTVYLSNLINSSVYGEVYNEIERALKKQKVNIKTLSGTRDIWARDYMPVQISEKKFLQYIYDPDYLQGKGKKRRAIKTAPEFVCDQLPISTIKTDLIIDGGNVVRSSDRVIMTDKVIKENEEFYTHEEIKKLLQDLLEVDKLTLIPWDEEDFTGHADGMLRFIDNDTVLLNGIYDYHNEYCEKLKNAIKEAGLNIEWLKVSTNEEKTWAYINFLQVKDVILISKLKRTELDLRALEKIKEYFPNSPIEQINTSELIKGGGALNCASWTVFE